MDQALVLLTAHHQLGRFSGVAVVASDTAVLCSVALGLADRERGLPHTPASRFPIGSITKQFTAAAAVLLAKEGALDLDAPIGVALQDLHLAWGQQVTARYLLDHTAGIPSVLRPHEGIAVLVPDETERAIAPAALVARFARLPLRAPPGARFEYSNSGYVLLALLIERAAGAPFHQVLAERVLAPAGSAAGPDVEHVPGYVGDRRVPPLHLSWLLGAGDLVATAADLVAWGRSALAAGLPAGPVEGTYRDGRRLGLRRGRRAAYHEGALPGHAATLHLLPDQRLIIAVLVNHIPRHMSVPFMTRHLNQLADDLASLAMGEPLPAAEEPADDGLAPRAAALFLALAQGRYADALAMGATPLIQVGLDGLRATWQDIVGSVGVLGETAVLHTEEGAVVLRCAFTRGTYDVRVSFDSGGLIAGFMFLGEA